MEKTCRNLEEQSSEYKTKVDETQRALSDYAITNARLLTENGQFMAQVTEVFRKVQILGF